MYTSQLTRTSSNHKVSDMKGYLVVLSVPVRISPLNPRYRGLFRGPGWPTGIPEEEEPLDNYVFGPYMSDPEGGLIPTLDLARELLGRFSRSPREFEIIYCKTPDEGNFDYSYSFLGYDVASVLPFWSAVADWPTSEGFERFGESLNEFGLFPDLELAERFIQALREAYPEQQQTALYIWEIHSVPASA